MPTGAKEDEMRTFSESFLCAVRAFHPGLEAGKTEIGQLFLRVHAETVYFDSYGSGCPVGRPIERGYLRSTIDRLISEQGDFCIYEPPTDADHRCARNGVLIRLGFAPDPEPIL